MFQVLSNMDQLPYALQQQTSNIYDVQLGLVDHTTTLYPTKYPTANPTSHPTKYPTVHQTAKPTSHPTKHPTIHPTSITVFPTLYNATFYRGFYGSWMTKYTINTQQNQCNLPTTLLLASHKTGGYFSQWNHVFQEECNCIGKNKAKLRNNRNKNILFFIGHQNWNDVTKFINRFPNHNNYLILLSVRHPLETILSGYNYHASGAETQWTTKNIAQPPAGMFNKPLKYCFQDLWSKQFLISGQNTMYNEYRKGYMNNYSDHRALQYGLYLEMLRYTHCEYVYMYDVYQKFKAHMEQYNVLFVRFDWFHDANYTQSIYYLLDAMQIDRNVYLNKTNLASRLLGYDLSKLPPNGHSTKGKYNHSLQRELLLTSGVDNNVCLQIKKMSIELDFPWQYSDKC